MSKPQTATEESIRVQRLIQLILKMGTLQVSTKLEVAENPAVEILLGTTYNYRCIKGIFCMEMKIFAIHSAPERILDRQQALSKESNTLVDMAFSLDAREM